jgi:hypothetical protein
MDYLKNNVKIKELTLNIEGVCKIEEHFGFIRLYYNRGFIFANTKTTSKEFFSFREYDVRGICKSIYMYPD